MPDRRALPRQTPAFPLSCRLTGPTLPAPVPAVLVDFTARGCGLLLPERVEPGGLSLVLGGGHGSAVPVRLVHVMPGPRGGYVAGVALEGEFEAPDLKELLAG
jgi:hypothetical protein